MNRTNQRIDEDDDQNDRRITPLAHRKRDHGSDEQNVNQRAGELLDKHTQERFVLFFRQHVCAMSDEAACGLLQ